MSEWRKHQHGDGFWCVLDPTLPGIHWEQEIAECRIEAQADAILREHELAQSHSKGMAILAGEVHEARAKLKEKPVSEGKWFPFNDYVRVEKLQAAEARIAELEAALESVKAELPADLDGKLSPLPARVHRLALYWHSCLDEIEKQQAVVKAAEAEAAALRAKVTELETALADFRKLPWWAETPATAGETC